MVDPLGPASNFFLGFLASLPSPIKLLLYLSIGLAVLAVIVRLIFR